MVWWEGGSGGGGLIGVFSMVSPPSGAGLSVQPPLVRLMDPQCSLLMMVLLFGGLGEGWGRD